MLDQFGLQRLRPSLLVFGLGAAGGHRQGKRLPPRWPAAAVVVVGLLAVAARASTPRARLLRGLSAQDGEPLASCEIHKSARRRANIATRDNLRTKNLHVGHHEFHSNGAPYSCTTAPGRKHGRRNGRRRARSQMCRSRRAGEHHRARGRAHGKGSQGKVQGCAKARPRNGARRVDRHCAERRVNTTAVKSSGDKREPRARGWRVACCIELEPPPQVTTRRRDRPVSLSV